MQLNPANDNNAWAKVERLQREVLEERLKNAPQSVWMSEFDRIIEKLITEGRA